MCVSFFVGDIMKNDGFYMELALKESLKALKSGDVPIGCVIVKDDKIISKAYNKKEKLNNVTKHAEIIAIEKACKKLKTWHLDECTIYTTMEPYLMCSGAIIQSRIKKIVYALPNPSFGEIENNNKVFKNIEKVKIIDNIYKNESKKIVQNFFKNIR